MFCFRDKQAAIAKTVLFAVLCPGALAPAQNGSSVIPQYSNSDTVFIGWLESGVESTEGYTDTFHVEQPIKGLTEGQTKATVKIPAETSCGNFSDMGEYLVYAKRVQGELYFSICH